MPRCSHVWSATILLSLLSTIAWAADRPAKQTHLLQPMTLEVATTQENGNPWDTGIGAFARPDPQVTLLRHDERALQAATDLLVKAMVEKMEELGRPVNARLKEQLPGTAIQALRCGAAVAALNNQPLTDARSKFASDTKVASDSFLAKLVDGGLQVSLGDKVSIYVNDIDIAAHDTLGHVELEITKAMLAKGEVELKFKDVKSLKLQLTPIRK